MTSDSELHQRLMASLDGFRDPETGRMLSKTGQVTDWYISHGAVRCRLCLSTHSLPIASEVIESFRQYLMAQVEGVQEVTVETGTLHRPAVAAGQIGLKVKSVIAVGSGKGGVGKSTIAASLALTLGKFGSRVGLLDADVYGPSVPHLLGLSGRPEVVDGKIQPIRAGEMPVMSMGFLVEKDQAVIWRGPMLHGSITQFLRDTNWGELDYLIIDMPPGTGDVAITLSQMIPLAGAVVVCTPQEVALLDAIKAISMFGKTNIPILGMVENMSGFICPGCGKSYDIFGRGGARDKAIELGIPFLGEVPINISLRQKSDTGNLADILESDPICAAPMERIARALVRNLAARTATSPPTLPLPVLG